MSTTKVFRVILPTKPYLKKYLQALYGLPIIFNKDNFLTTLAASLLRKNEVRKPSQKHITVQGTEYNDSVDLYFPQHFMNNSMYGSDLTNADVHAINKILENQFQCDLYRYTSLLQILDIQLQDAITAFCQTHSIDMDDDISFETIKKKQYRYRTSLQQGTAPETRYKTPKVLQLLLL